MRYAGLIKNDLAAAPGVCVSFFVQGCPLRCPGCHNPESWDFEGGMEFSTKTLNDILTSLSANGIERSLCIMGGEPLCEENLFLTALIVKEVREYNPNLKIYLWTGYYIEDLKAKENNKIDYILNNIDCLIDGPFVQEERDLTLQMRGSRNQRIIYLTNK
jgi:anaerobic ribonucleoside-triphosphate reductase activating protein